MEIIGKNKSDFDCSDCSLIIFLIFSLLHFFSISQINGIIYSLIGEVKRSFFYYFKSDFFEDEDGGTKKSFYEILISSNQNDSSQINFFYASFF